VDFAAGATAKSTSLTLQSASGLGVGSHLMVTQLNDPSYVTITTNNGSCTWCDGGIGWNGTRVQGQIVEVTGVSGNTVTISPALYLAYSRTPLATPVSMGATNAGVENLQVYMNNSGFTANFLMQGTGATATRSATATSTMPGRTVQAPRMPTSSSPTRPAARWWRTTPCVACTSPSC
jgi:hypothetical protein